MICDLAEANAFVEENRKPHVPVCPQPPRLSHRKGYSTREPAAVKPRDFGHQPVFSCVPTAASVSTRINTRYAKYAEVTVPSLADWEKDWQENPQRSLRPMLQILGCRLPLGLVTQSN